MKKYERSIILNLPSATVYNIVVKNQLKILKKALPKDYKGWIYIYVNKYSPIMVYHPYNCEWVLWDDIMYEGAIYENWRLQDLIQVNGKVIARFWFDEYDKYYFNPYHRLSYKMRVYILNKGDYRLVPKSRELLTNATMPLSDLCLTLNEVERYGKEKELFAWYIKKLEIFDRPKELSDFGLTKAPQSYQYVYVKE